MYPKELNVRRSQFVFVLSYSTIATTIVISAVSDTELETTQL